MYTRSEREAEVGFECIIEQEAEEGLECIISKKRTVKHNMKCGMFIKWQSLLSSFPIVVFKHTAASAARPVLLWLPVGVWSSFRIICINLVLHFNVMHGTAKPSPDLYPCPHGRPRLFPRLLPCLLPRYLRLARLKKDRRARLLGNARPRYGSHNIAHRPRLDRSPWRHQWVATRDRIRCAGRLLARALLFAGAVGEAAVTCHRPAVADAGAADALEGARALERRRGVCACVRVCVCVLRGSGGGGGSGGGLVGIVCVSCCQWIHQRIGGGLRLRYGSAHSKSMRTRHLFSDSVAVYREVTRLISWFVCCLQPIQSAS